MQPERAVPPRYSIVVPFHDEQDSVRELHQRLSQVMTGRFDPVEFVYVDDQSSDATPQILAAIADEDPRVAVLRLKRNYGQTTALAAGFDFASGDIIISMDGDLQHDPADIPELLAVLEATHSDIVSGWREKRVDNFLLRRLPSRIANWMMSKLSGVDIHDFGTTFKAYRREIIHNIPLYGEMHRFIPALASWYGASICEIPIHNINRERGKSHYGLGRTFRVFFDLLTIRFLLRYMSRPLHFFGGLGALGILGGTGVALILLVMKILNPAMDMMHHHGPMFVIGSVLILAGIQLLAIGLLGELQVRHHYTGQHPASYAVDRIVRLAMADEQNILSERQEGNF